jgi:hypothetical protein
LFGDGAITLKKNDRNFASCATRNDAVFCHFLSGDTPSSNKKINLFLKYLGVYFTTFGHIFFTLCSIFNVEKWTPHQFSAKGNIRRYTGLTVVRTGALAPDGTVAILPDSIPSHWEGKQHCWKEDPTTDNKITNDNMLNIRPLQDKYYID